MTASWKYAKEIYLLLGDSRRHLPKMLVLFIFSGLLDIVGLGLIAPYVALVIDPSAIEDWSITNYFNMVGGPNISPEQLIMILGVSLLALYFSKAIAAYYINRSILRFSWGQQVRLRKTLMESYQSLPYNVYMRRNSSEYIQTILGLTGNFSVGVVMNGLKVLSDGIIGFSILFVLTAVNPVALVLLIVLIGTTILGYDRLLKNNLKELGEKVVFSEERVTKAVQEGMRGFKEIRVIGAEFLFFNIVDKNSKEVANASTLRDLIMGVPRYLLDFALFLFVVLLVTAAINFDYQRETLIPTLTLFGVGALRLIPLANSFAKSLMSFRFNRYPTSRLYTDVQEMRDLKKPISSKMENGKAETFLSLEAKNITFFYEDANKPTLLNLNFKIYSGDTIGVMGPSGSGKTTFVDVMLGMLEPQEGLILVNKSDLRSKLLDWRSQVAYLPQDGFIIDDTLRRNITLEVNDQINEDRLQQVLYQAQLFKLVDDLPNGTETLLGETGIRLSGGQRQRVSIARALYRDRQVLIMDEATSALDDETESEIVDEIERLKGTVTTLVIAHRLSTLRHCDRVYCLKEGKMVEVD